MANGHARLTGLDPPYGLHMHPQPGRCGGLTFACVQPRLFGGAAQEFQGVKHIVADVGRNSFALRHGGIVGVAVEGRQHRTAHPPHRNTTTAVSSIHKGSSAWPPPTVWAWAWGARAR